MLRRATSRGIIAALLSALLAGSTFLAAPSRAVAQQPTQPPPKQPPPKQPPPQTPKQSPPQQPTIVPDTSAFRVPPGTPSPAGAMLRSFLVPGWGQASAHAYFRGGVYFATESASWYMLIKTILKLSEVQELEGRRKVLARDSILQAAAHALYMNDSTLYKQIQDPRLLSQMVDSSSQVKPVHGVVVSRQKQREDWIVQVVFWTMFSGLDAYVATQLADFPAHVSAERTPGGGVALKVSVPVGRRH
jgi:Family of unknown function (DUF5683)